MRQCSKCKQEKPETEFGKNSAYSDGKHKICRQCVNSMATAQRNTYPEKTKETLKRHMRKRRESNPQLYLWQKARDRVKYEYAREFTITPEDIIIPALCPFLGIELNSGDPDAWASLDRIDSSKGYTKDNIQVISLLANQMKNRATKDQLIAFAKGVLAVYSQEV